MSGTEKVPEPFWRHPFDRRREKTARMPESYTHVRPRKSGDRRAPKGNTHTHTRCWCSYFESNSFGGLLLEFRISVFKAAPPPPPQVAMEQIGPNAGFCRVERMRLTVPLLGLLLISRWAPSGAVSLLQHHSQVALLEEDSGGHVVAFGKGPQGNTYFLWCILLDVRTLTFCQLMGFPLSH